MGRVGPFSQNSFLLGFTIRKASPPVDQKKKQSEKHHSSVRNKNDIVWRLELLANGGTFYALNPSINPFSFSSCRRRERGEKQNGKVAKKIQAISNEGPSGTAKEEP